ncbi:MAG: hydroxymethylbilane synthase [bacterium]|nr:hydroxymethylbilane synthase [bacterium]
MNERVFKLGTRGSPLALWQAERVKALLAERRPESRIEIEIIHTIGDKILDKPLVQVGGKGVFTKEIETALQEGSIDFAVHSFKDLPTVQPEGLGVVAIPERESPFDALFSRKYKSLGDMPERPVIATGSLRRRAQILALRPEAEVIDLRGNVNTRLKKFEESKWDGMIMASAAIRRMEWEGQSATPLSPAEMLPAPAQGALAIEARLDDESVIELLSSLHDESAAVSVAAERAFLAELEGGCQVPMAAYSVVTGDKVTLDGLVAALNGTPLLRGNLTGLLSESAELGVRLANRLLETGGAEIIESLKELNESKA